MCRTHCLRKEFAGLAAAILAANGAVAIAAAGQTKPTELAEDCAAYASVPLPAEAEKIPVPKTAPACASYRSYRGIGRPVNYSEARACAWQERQAARAQNQEEPTAWVVGGSLILADIYVNGAGVKRDIPLAMRFACESDGIGASALRDITKGDGSTRKGGPVELCDYAATTFMQNFCSGYEAEVEDSRRRRYFDSLKPSMTVEQKAAFEKLLAAQIVYVQMHASEVDQRGTIHNIRTSGSMEILNDLFRTDLAHFERQQWPRLSESRVASADALSRREYERKLQELRGQTKEAIDEGAVTADGLSRVEAVWETYRDAWVAFARLRYPATVDVVRAEITLDRYRLVRTIF